MSVLFHSLVLRVVDQVFILRVLLCAAAAQTYKRWDYSEWGQNVVCMAGSDALPAREHKPEPSEHRGLRTRNGGRFFQSETFKLLASQL
jgi:hypothetical protein